MCGALGYAHPGMRCASCGTENTPDSRFCGGCGARTPGPSLVAPTVKLADDARYPTSPSTRPTPVAGMQSVAPSMPAPGPVQRPMSGPQPVQRPMSEPQPVQRPPVQRPMSGPQPVRAPISTPPPGAVRRPVAPASEPALPVASGRRWGLVAAVLLVDLGLAGAGAYMVSRSLGGGTVAPADAARGGPASASSPPPARSLAVTAPTPSPSPGAATAAMPGAAPAPAPAAAPAAAPAPATSASPAAAPPATACIVGRRARLAPRHGASRGRPAPRRAAGTATPARGAGSAPLDPYAVDDPPPAPGTP